MSETTSRKRKLSLPLIVAGGVSSLVLALGMSPTFSAFSASIQNTVNTAGAGALIMQETDSTGTILCNSTDGGSISTNAATCATINKYGGNLNMAPGQTVTTTINIKNTGTVGASSFALTPGACTQTTNGSNNGTATDLCSKINLLIKSGSVTIFSGTATALNTGGVIDLDQKLAMSSIATGSSTPFTFAVTLDSSVGNTYQGLKVSQAMTWAFGA
jgi:hypothetical protein